MDLDPSSLENPTIRPTQPLLEVYGAAELRPSIVVASAFNRGERSNAIRRARKTHSVKMSLRGHDRNCALPEDITGRARRVPVGEVSWRTTFRALRHRNYRL